MGANKEVTAPIGLFATPKHAGPIDWEFFVLIQKISFLRIGYFGVIFTPIFASGILEIHKYIPSLHISLPHGMFVTFLGSTFLAAGHLLNEILAPKLIKIHQSQRAFQQFLADFVRNEDTIFRAGMTAERIVAINKLRDRLPTDTSPKAIQILAEGISKQISELQQAPLDEDEIVTNYRAEWERANIWCPLVRYFIAGCYGVAAFIALYLALSQLVSVFCAAFP